MRVLILSFDGLSGELARKFGCEHLLQVSQGRIDLTPYFLAGGGKKHDDGIIEPLTHEIYATFLSGKLPNKHKIKGVFTCDNLHERNIKTILHQPDSVGIDVPTWSESILQHIHRKLIIDMLFKKNITLSQVEKIVFDDINRQLEAFRKCLIPIWRKRLVFKYFSFIDLFSHVYTDFERFKERYRKIYLLADKVAKEMLHAFTVHNIGKTFICLIFSDHETFEGAHRSYGFYSLSKRWNKSSVKINEWHDIILRWLKE